MQVLKCVDGVKISFKQPKKNYIPLVEYMYDINTGLYYIKSYNGYYLDYRYNTPPIFMPKMVPQIELYVAIEEKYKNRILFDIDKRWLKEKCNRTNDKFEYYLLLLYKSDMKRRLAFPTMYEYVAELEVPNGVSMFVGGKCSRRYYESCSIREYVRQKVKNNIILNEYFHVCFSRWWNAVKFLFQYCYRKKIYPDLHYIAVDRDGYWIKMKLPIADIIKMFKNRQRRCLSLC